MVEPKEWREHLLCLNIPFEEFILNDSFKNFNKGDHRKRRDIFNRDQIRIERTHRGSTKKMEHAIPFSLHSFRRIHFAPFVQEFLNGRDMKNEGTLARQGIASLMSQE